jgi:hypothetical protein
LSNWAQTGQTSLLVAASGWSLILCVTHSSGCNWLIVLPALPVLIRRPPRHISGPPRVVTAMESHETPADANLRKIFASYNEAWMKYWQSYVSLQDQLYESLRAGRDVSWLAASDEKKLSEINQVQRELFAGMPRRLDYSPLGQITRDLGSAPTKIADLEEALSKEERACADLEAAIALMKAKVEEMKQAMRAAGP